MSALPQNLSGVPAGDLDSQETLEWKHALKAVIEQEGPERAHFLLEQLLEHAREHSIDLPFSATTGYVNSIEPGQEAHSPGNLDLEGRLRAYMRWNAMAMVVKANRLDPADGGDLGGHISSFQSLAHMFAAGFNHFWHGDNTDEGGTHGGDLLYIQGHSSPGIYARAYLEGRITEEQMLNFRQEVDGKGLSSYPHPKLMPGFWQFPTVSMGLGPIMAIYQARFLKYLHARGIADTAQRKVWVFCGDGEMDEPESLGAIGLAAREKLDNLVFVVNCNLQRLDGPVRGNGKIIQELEGEFRGAGWNVIKLIWGSEWDKLLARDKDGALRKLMMDTLDGDYQAFKANDGAFVRKNFFGRDPRTLEMVSRMSDEEVWGLRRGGHDAQKVYAAYATRPTTPRAAPPFCWSRPSRAGAWARPARARTPRTRPRSSVTTTSATCAIVSTSRSPTASCPGSRSTNRADDTPEMKYLHERRKALGGYLPKRRPRSSESFTVPSLETFKAVLEDTAEGREISTTQAYVRFLNAAAARQGDRPARGADPGGRSAHLRHGRPVPPDRHLLPFGQKYTPVEADQLMFYKEDTAGQVLQEGINEAGSISSWIAAATSYSTNNVPMMPFYIFYSMFGFQRIGDSAWQAADMRARGFLLGATAGRTTLNGEGLQHEDGHSQLLAGNIPNCAPTTRPSPTKWPWCCSTACSG
jgi:pyruvate dehydrogenase E1 component